MIYWFTGQPGAGKTVLSRYLHSHLKMKPFLIDGDDLRELTTNKDYSINGRVNNVNIAQKIAHYLHNQSRDVIVALVSPYIDQREEFKSLMGDQIVEFYVHTTEKRQRDHFRAIAYTPPLSNFVDIDTTHDTEEQSFDKVLKSIQ
tara:strand:- start:624 stop:1058 length:435 start_codon:yes stop_codon:yes gene_type:complete